MIDPREAFLEMERALSRRSFFKRVLQGAGAIAAFDRFGPRLFGQAQTPDDLFNHGLQIVSAFGRLVIPVDQDPGWATFEPDITQYTLDVYIRQVFNLGNNLAFVGYLQAVNAFDAVPKLIGYGPTFVTMSTAVQGQYMSDVLIGNFESDGVQDIVSFGGIFLLLATKMVFFQNFPHPLLQAPGIGSGAPGFSSRPAGLPTVLQSSVRVDFPPNLVNNLSVPGAKLSDVLKGVPVAPLIQAGNVKQTLTNFILGYPALIAGNTLPLVSQVNYATKLLNPTLLLVEVGYYDVLDAAVSDDPSRLPDPDTFGNDYKSMLSMLNGSGRTIVVLTIPDPFDTAYFTSVGNATRLLGAPPAALSSLFHFNTGDTITPNGMMAAGGLILTNSVPSNFPLSLLPGLVVSASTATAVHQRVLDLNAAIAAAASQTGANVLTFDLYGELHKVRTSGTSAG